MKNYRIYLPAILSCLLMLSCIKEKPVEVIPVTDISFDAEEIDRANTLTIKGIGEQFELSAIVEPANANETLIWEIENRTTLDIFSINDDLGHQITFPLTGIVAVKGNQYNCKEFDKLSIDVRFMPENATNKSTRTIVQDNSILRFDGKSSSATFDFVALKPGHTKVSIFSAEDSDLAVVLDVTVAAAKLPDGAVDMGYRLNNGMPVYFASCNLGATTPAAAGEFYAWGDPEPYYHSMNPWVWKDGKKDGYTPENYKYYVKKSKSYSKYVTLPEYGTPDNNKNMGFVFFDGDIYIRPELRSFGEGIRPVWRGYPEK